MGTSSNPPSESAYVRFPDSPAPYSYSSEHLEHPSSDPPTPTLGAAAAAQRGGVRGWASSIRQCLWPSKQPSFQSQYLTLIPLSDARLKPRRTKLIVSSLLLLAVVAVVAVFLMVPRAVSIGTISVHSTKMTLNATTLTIRIILVARVPFENANYMHARVNGNVTVSFFDAEAGWTAVADYDITPRIQEQVLDVRVDASNLPRRYNQVVYTQCINFPQKLIFFLLASFNVTLMGYHYPLPDVDTYFMLDCTTAVVTQHPNSSIAAAAAAGLEEQVAGGAAAAAAAAAGGPQSLLVLEQHPEVVARGSMHPQLLSSRNSGRQAAGAGGVAHGSARGSSNEQRAGWFTAR